MRDFIYGCLYLIQTGPEGEWVCVCEKATRRAFKQHRKQPQWGSWQWIRGSGLEATWICLSWDGDPPCSWNSCRRRKKNNPHLPLNHVKAYQRSNCGIARTFKQKRTIFFSCSNHLVFKSDLQFQFHKLDIKSKISTDINLDAFIYDVGAQTQHKITFKKEQECIVIRTGTMKCSSTKR